MQKPLTKIVLLVLTFAFGSCSNSGYNSDIQGKWKVVKAQRNGRHTSTLQDAYFKFWNMDTMQTNLINKNADTYPYTLGGSKINTDEKFPEIEIEEVKNDSMTINFEYLEYYFSLILVKETAE